MSEKHIIKLSAIIAFFKDDEKLISRGENALDSGHVKNSMFDASLRIAKGSVLASMRDKEYKVEVNFSPEWSIGSATCSCPRGQLVCHHMAAVILFCRYNVSVTDKSCLLQSLKKVKGDEIKTVAELFPPKNTIDHPKRPYK
ncbi:hypothetical protein FQR65_LT20047 [Abscondita terminalis]|nr:hypothetical protein FQR65_LT20047 [Abscondita terminalis]